jgi:hypothetical protein
VSWFFDPKIFNYVIMGLYSVNVLRWSVHGGWVDAAYWACALGITACVTFGYGRT